MSPKPRRDPNDPIKLSRGPMVRTEILPSGNVRIICGNCNAVTVSLPGRERIDGWLAVHLPVCKSSASRR